MELTKAQIAAAAVGQLLRTKAAGRIRSYSQRFARLLA